MAKLKILMENRHSTFQLRPVHPDHVEAVVRNLKNSNAFGTDEIDTYTVKLVKSELLPVITHVINLSIVQRKFPDLWKTAKIIPLHKKGDTLDPKNYRPVALLPVLSKVLERIIFDQIMAYLNNYDLLHPNQHAYRANHNTTTAL